MTLQKDIVYGQREWCDVPEVATLKKRHSSAIFLDVASICQDHLSSFSLYKSKYRFV
jgi:hypothetical protein